jgi:hypothetical protein
LRSYMRENILRFMADQGMALDDETSQASASIDLTKFYASTLPLAAKVRFLANEDVQNYFYCGRYLPVKIEMESSYPVWTGMNLRARMQAPFDDLLKLEVGSSFCGPGPLTSKIQYTFAASRQIYAGMNIGLGMDLQFWHLEYECNLAPGMVQLQRISLGRRF